MTDWHSPAVVQQTLVSLAMIYHALLGVFAWEWLVTLPFDLSFFTGKKRFRWPMVFYFMGRYAMFCCIVGSAYMFNSTTEVNCRLYFRIMIAFANTAICMASLNLSLRTMAVYNQAPKIVIPLVLFILGHLGILIRAATTVDAHWVDTRPTGCVDIYVDPVVYAVLFCYTMVFDLVILVLMGSKLWWLYSVDDPRDRALARVVAVKKGWSPKRRRKGLAQLLFQDGMVYFLVAFAANVVAMVFSIMNLNTTMSLIGDISAVVIPTIASGRVVRRLSVYHESESEIRLTDILPSLPNSIQKTEDRGGGAVLT